MGQDDGKGKIYNTTAVNIVNDANSTINYATGSLTLNYNQIPAQRVEISVIYTPDIDGLTYVTASDIAGPWQKTRVYTFIDTINSAIGAGDGEKLQFNGNLGSTVMKGSVEILHDGAKIGEDNGRGKITGTNIDSNNSTINYTTGALVLNYLPTAPPPYYRVAISANYTKDEDIHGDINRELYTDIATDKNNKVHLSFYDPIYGNLKYATNSSGTWSTETVDSGTADADVGKYTSIKVDDSDVVHISYYDSTNKNLKYVYGKTGRWNGLSTAVYSTGDAGKYSFLAIHDGKVYITIFYKNTVTGKSYIYLLTNSTPTGVFRHEPLVEVGGETKCPIDIDSNGIIHMSYISYISLDKPALGKALYYTSRYCSSWSPSYSVDPKYDSDTSIGDGVYVSLAVNKDGKVRIAYYDATEGDLKYAHQN